MERVARFLKTATNGRDSLKATTALLAPFIAFISWCIYDYRQYLALGPGGPPYNARGWAMITFKIRPFALSYAGRLDTSDYPAKGASEHILAIPRRQGPRAATGGIAPHRQQSQHAPESMRPEIEALFTEAVTQNPEILETRLSLYERHHSALFVKYDLLNAVDGSVPAAAITARGEVGHVHPDLSIHLYTSPADAKVLIEKGWAERHRLAVPNTHWVGNQYAVADTYLMVYGPRNKSEVENVREMLLAGIQYMSGRSDVKLE